MNKYISTILYILFYLPTMFKFPALLFVIKLYAQNNILKKMSCSNYLPVIDYNIRAIFQIIANSGSTQKCEHFM